MDMNPVGLARSEMWKCTPPAGFFGGPYPSKNSKTPMHKSWTRSIGEAVL